MLTNTCGSGALGFLPFPLGGFFTPSPDTPSLGTPSPGTPSPGTPSLGTPPLGAVVTFPPSSPIMSKGVREEGRQSGRRWVDEDEVEG